MIDRLDSNGVVRCLNITHRLHSSAGPDCHRFVPDRGVTRLNCVAAAPAAGVRREAMICALSRRGSYAFYTTVGAGRG